LCCAWEQSRSLLIDLIDARECLPKHIYPSR
jgi:hypothetical protein